MPLEQIRTAASVGVSLDPAQLGFLRRNHHRPDAALAKEFQDVFARFSDQLVGEKIAVADDYAERSSSFGHGEQATGTLRVTA
jgi:hypothetical protein